ncbi:MAG: RnfH family protein [Betaproteobacteria bacterium]|nr:RnfH family protein [Betaproteobacteria bacterium]
MNGIAGARGEPSHIRISVAWASADVACLIELDVPAGCRLADAVAAACGAGLPAAVAADPGVGVAVFGRLRGPDHALVAGDRVELLGPLRVDPKVARERRVAHKRAQASGLGTRSGRGRPRLNGPGTRPGSTAPASDGDG